MKRYNHLLLFALTLFVWGSYAEIKKDSSESEKWYQQNVATLNHDLTKYLKIAQESFSVPLNAKPIKALIVPHAGYDFSGLCAACAYQTLLGPDGKKNETIKRVIVLAPSHFESFKGIALPAYSAYKTVLGNCEVDEKILRKLNRKYNFQTLPVLKSKEHSIEMQLPFLQRTIKNFKLIPLLVGTLLPQDAKKCASVLKNFLDSSTLLVVSTDFIHFGKNFAYTPVKKNIYNSIKAVDGSALRAIVNGSLEQFNALIAATNATICGFTPLQIFISLLNQKGLGEVSSSLCCYYNSAQIIAAQKGDTIDLKKMLIPPLDYEMNSAVSYASLVFTAGKESGITLSEYEKKALLQTSRAALENSFKDKADQLQDNLLYPLMNAHSEEKRGVFVTLKTKRGTLRGCIGTVSADQPLYKNVIAMTKAAAFEDPRFNQVQKQELKNIIIEISVLEKAKPIKNYQDIL